MDINVWINNFSNVFLKPMFFFLVDIHEQRWDYDITCVIVFVGLWWIQIFSQFKQQ